MSVKKGEIHIGFSGWSYSDWKKNFYPVELKSTEFLSFYSQTYNCCEINSSFYHLPRRTTIEKWIEQVPAEFKFCPKMSKYFTHIKRLKEPEDALPKFFEAFEPMKKRMGPILLQLPPSLKFEPDVALNLFKELKKNYAAYQFALEARHVSWFTDKAYALMKKYHIAFVISESGGRFPYAEAITAKNIYIRFHGPKALYASSHSHEELETYARKLKKWKKEGYTIWVFFNNTVYPYALNNASTLLALLN